MRTIKIAVRIILGIALFTLVVMLLWNWLVPALFGGPVITYFQSLGLIVLSKIIFGGFGGGAAVFQRARNRRFWDRFKEKMEHMTPEEKEKFRSNICF
jgi:hypothetical protein